MCFIRGTQCDLTSWLEAQIPSSVLGLTRNFPLPSAKSLVVRLHCSQSSGNDGE